MSEDTFKTDEFKLLSHPLVKLNILGVEVEFREFDRVESKEDAKKKFHKLPVTVHHVNAYVELKNSSVMSDNALAYPTFREKDWIGVDTGHSWNEGYTELQSFLSAYGQIELAIKSWKKIVREVA